VNDALIVVDVISRFEHEDGEALLASFQDRVAAMIDALAEARGAGTPVIYVNDQDGRWDSDAPRLTREARSGRGGEVVERLLPEAEDRLVLKPRYSIFDHTPLELLLSELAVERLLLMGATTEGCVVQSGIDARELGFKVTILARACATIDPELEELALRYASRVAGMRIDRDAAGRPGLPSPAASGGTG
jgi:nicotinamidase-related amidase